ncbi:MAG: exodeoxyribonuclease VII small subunit [Candidatus Dormibacteraeota bacterium]|nr:exodeoxyribonuclease VII small subunit [Candidatus Dormibacteraeota bacterium]
MKDPGSLEELLRQLEDTLHRLADPGAPLERAVSDYEQAERLLSAAEDRLREAAAAIAEVAAET